MYLRSLLAKYLAPMCQYVPDPSFSSLSDPQRQAVWLLMSVAGHKRDATSKYEMNGMMQSLYPDADQAIAELDAAGYLRPTTLQEMLSTATVANLKTILASVGQVQTGKKEALIQRIIDTVPESSIRQYPFIYQLLIPSEKGYHMLRSLYLEREEAEQRVFQAIRERRYLDGTWEVHEYERKCPFQSPYHISTPAPAPEVQAYLASHEPSDNEVWQLASHFWGGTLLTKMPNPEEDAGELRYRTQVAEAQATLREYQSLDETHYTVMGCLDDRICPLCAKHERHAYPISEAKIGVNFPPFHEGCRCTTFYGVAESSIGRAARDPITGKTYITSARTYAEWVKSLTPAQRKALKDKQ